MKNFNLTNIALAVLMAVAFVACGGKNDPDEPAAPEEMYATSLVSAPVSGAEVAYEFRTNCAWEFSVPSTAADWVSVDPLKGTATKEVTVRQVKITVRPNSAEDDRAADLKIKYGTNGYTKTVKVSQRGTGSPYKPVSSQNITDDLLFSTGAAGYSNSVIQSFDFNEDASMIYFSQLASYYQNGISWNGRIPVTSSTTLAKNKMLLRYFSHGDHIHYQKADGNDYIWIGNYGTRSSDEKYVSPQILSRIKLENGKEIRNTETDDNYWFNIKGLHASFDEKNDHIAIWSGTVTRIYKLSEVLAAPQKDITLTSSITYGGGSAHAAPDAEWTGKPLVRAHDCTGLKPLYMISFNFEAENKAIQGFCIDSGKVYFFGSSQNITNGMLYQSVIDIFDYSGTRLAKEIQQPFASNLEDLERYSITDAATRKVEPECIIVRDGAAYLGYGTMNAAAFRRPVVFVVDEASLHN